MSNIGVVVRLAANNFRRWLIEPRYWVSFLLAAFVVHGFSQGFVAFSQVVDVPVAPWTLPFLLGDLRVCMPLFFGAVLLFCDAPFIHDLTPYESIRAGKARWLCGQLLYVLLATVVYVLFVAAVSILTLVPHLGFTFEWGRILSTAALTTAGYNYIDVPIPYVVQVSYTPACAMALSSGLFALEVALIGLAMFAVNLYTGRAAGIAVGLVASLAPQLFQFSGSGYWMYHFAPTAWSDLSILDTTGFSPYPTVSYALAVLIGACLVLVTVSLFKARSLKIDVSKPL
jgi:hypothetical protein